MSVWIDCTALKFMPTSLAMLCRSRLHITITHNQGVHDLDICISAGAFGRPDLPSSSTLSLPLLNSADYFFHCAIRRRLLPKGFHEVFMNFLGRHFFLTEVLDKRSDFKFLHFANVSHPPLLKGLYISNQA